MVSRSGQQRGVAKAISLQRRVAESPRKLIDRDQWSWESKSTLVARENGVRVPAIIS